MIFWTLAMVCYAVFRFYGLREEVAFGGGENFDESFSFGRAFGFLALVGLGLGFLFGWVDVLFEKYKPKKLPLGLNVLLKTALYFLVAIFVITTAGSAAVKVFNFDFEFGFGWWMRDKRFWSALTFIVLSSLVFSFLKIAQERFGRGLFLKMLLGAYKNPKEEERIFMFLDLKDSTGIAEELGHHHYSQFLQDSFFDLNEVVLKYEAEIYQYVGDEAVLSWKYKKGLSNNNCVELFFAFQRQLLSKKEYYFRKYGLCPEFKAGLHGGALMVAEVGFVKKELAYHGDVINTASRIQGECKKHKVNLLLSDTLLKDLSLKASQSLGSVSLRGKQEVIHIHSITR